MGSPAQAGSGVTPEAETVSPAQLKHLIAEDYEQSAEGYAQWAERCVYRFLAPVLADAVRRAGVDGTVLDVASGTGAVARLLTDAVAADIAHAQLTRNPATRRVRADAERLPFRDDAFAGCTCAFGIHHFPDPALAVAEMARVAPLVAITTWARPEIPYAPKRIVLDAIERQAGVARTRAARLADRLADGVGSVDAVGDLLVQAGLRERVRAVEAEVPWPGTEAFIRYRLSLMGAATLVRDLRALRREVEERIAALDRDDLVWRPRVVLGVGRRRPAGVSGAPGRRPGPGPDR